MHRISEPKDFTNLIPAMPHSFSKLRPSENVIAQTAMILRTQKTHEAVNCALCGEVHQWQEHPFGSAWLYCREECACERQARLTHESAERRAMTLQLYRNLCNLPAQFRETRIADVRRVKGMEAAIKTVKRYIQDWPHERNLILSGVVGCGKTMLAAAIANPILDKLYEARYINLLEHFPRVKACWGKPESNPPEMPATAALLVLDELGSKPEPWQEEYLYPVVNYRYDHRLPTVVVTNQTSEQSLAVGIGPRSVDRLLHHGEWVGITAASYRMKAYLEKKGERDGQ